MRVAILFGDNDFYYTNMAFMKVLAELFYNCRDDRTTVTKEEIVNLFNSLAYQIYMFTTHVSHPESPHDHLKKCLQINDSRVYLNDEIDKKLETYNQWGNGDFFYVDLDTLQFNCM